MGRTASEKPLCDVSTHSRAEAAAVKSYTIYKLYHVSTHSRAEAAAWKVTILQTTMMVSTHSRAEAAACQIWTQNITRASFNTQPRGGGCRRFIFLFRFNCVSTHSRAEAAALSDRHCLDPKHVSTHSRAEAAAVSCVR